MMKASRQHRLPLALLACVGALLFGCGGADPNVAPATGHKVRIWSPISSTNPSDPVRPAVDPKDPQGKVKLVTVLEVYQVIVPLGSISRNEEFWRHINEHCIDVSTYDLLYKNGIRVGQAAVDEWEYFRKIIEQNPARTHVTTIRTGDGTAVELNMRSEVVDQTIFYFNRRNELEGRSYELSNNLLSVAFEPVPRKVGDVRLRMCPMVRAMRKKFMGVEDDGHTEIRYANPERMYDLNLAADVPLDSFLIAAPSIEAAAATSIGNRFFVQDGGVSFEEQLLIFVPRLFRVDESNTATPPLAGTSPLK